MVRRIAIGIAALLLVIGFAAPTQAALYYNGFETDIAGWDAFGGSYNATRVASGSNGIVSAAGSWHAVSSASGSAGNWGGYNYGAGSVPTTFQAYSTSLAVYLNIDGGWANDTRFDYISAISNSAGTHRRDFVFNAGFYNDAGGPGSGSNRFVISASNNAYRSNSYPKNPGRDPIAILNSGWYTFEHSFYNDGGFLKADLNIFDTSSLLVHSWTLGGTDAIAGVGGNRYGWFINEFSVLAFDETELRLDSGEIPEPSSLIMLAIVAGAGLGLARRRRR